MNGRIAERKRRGLERERSCLGGERCERWRGLNASCDPSLEEFCEEEEGNSRWERGEVKEEQKLGEELAGYRWEEELEEGVVKRKIESGSNEDADEEEEGEEWW